jgi:hypothetical protein
MNMPASEITPLDNTERKLLDYWKALELSGYPLDVVKAYSREYAKYALLRVAQQCERDSQFSTARALRDRAESM